jgi:hypothetical protein
MPIIDNVLAQSDDPEMVHAWWTDVFPIGRLGKLKKIDAIFAYLAAEWLAFAAVAEFCIDGGSTI